MDKVFKAIRDKIIKSEKKITDRAIRYRIQSFKKTNDIASRKLAENAYANKLDISVDKLVTHEELLELQTWLSNKSPIARAIRSG